MAAKKTTDEPRSGQPVSELLPDRPTLKASRATHSWGWRADSSTGRSRKRRIHARPNAAEIAACRPWLETEIALVKPRVLVCLGATAAQALLGKRFKVSMWRI